MKKVIFLSLLILSFLTACKDDEEELIQNQRPDERLNETLSAYKEQLTGAEYGWKAVLLPAGGAGYNFLFNFGEDDRVAMYSDINASTVANAMSSTYRLKGMQTPSLLFDTYSYIHILSDPDATISQGDWGQGQYSDFEFAIESATTDSITLEGIYNGSKLILTRASQEDAENYIKNVAASAQALENIEHLNQYYFKRLTFGNSAFDVVFNTETRRLGIYDTGGNLNETSFYYTENGISLVEPFTSGNVSISTLNNIEFSPTNRRFSLSVNGTAATITEERAPAHVPSETAQSFYNSMVSYYITTGFATGENPDVHGVSTIPNLRFLILWPKYGTSGNTTYDLLGFVTEDQETGQLSLSFGPAATSRITTNGRIVYSYLGFLGPEELPEEIQSVVTATLEQWTDPQGFYVVQTSESTFDLVSVRDGNTRLSLLIE